MTLSVLAAMPVPTTAPDPVRIVRLTPAKIQVPTPEPEAAPAPRFERSEQGRRIDDLVGLNGPGAQQAAEDAAKAAKYGGWLSVANIDRLPAPVPIVDPYLALRDGEHAILYGDGGSTKGTTACLWIISIIRADPTARVLILDYENHEQEWKSRLSRMGATDAEQARVAWVSPYSPRWTGPLGTLGEVAEYVRDGCDALGITFLVLDSMSAALASSEAMGGISAAQEWGMALAKIGRRSLSIAHITGSSEKWPKKPFGSVHFRNMAREAWAIAVVESGQDFHLPNGLTGTYTKVELRCTKASDRMPPRDQVITYGYYGETDIHASSSPKPVTATGDRVALILGSNGGKAMTVADIVKALKEEYGEAVQTEAAYDLMRNDRGKRFVQGDGPRPRPWSLSTSSERSEP
jgi:AAA domain-containing protein